MRKHIRPAAFAAFILLFALLLSSVTGVLAAGNVSDPLVSLSYMNGAFRVSLFGEAVRQMDTSFSPIFEARKAKIISRRNELTTALSDADSLARFVGTAIADQYIAALPLGPVNGFTKLDLTKGMTLTGAAGFGIIVISGGIATSGGGVTLIDLSTGREYAPGWLLTNQHNYLVTENGGMQFTAIGAASVYITGQYTFSPETEFYQAKYTAMAEALKTMGLFVGSNIGFELDRAALRSEGITMFVRALGEQQAALASKDSSPFTDLLDWVRPIASWAYKNKLTAGISSSEFGCNQYISGDEYMTFVLRALGYTDTGTAPEFSYKQALEFAADLGIITQSEAAAIRNAPFYRDQMVFITYKSLSARLRNSNITMLDLLIQKGAVDGEAARIAMR